MNETNDNRNYRYDNRYFNQNQSYDQFYSNERYNNVRKYKDSAYQNQDNAILFQINNYQIDYFNNRNQYRQNFAFAFAFAFQLTNTLYRYEYTSSIENKEKQNAYQSYKNSNSSNTNFYQAKFNNFFVFERRSLQKTYHENNDEKFQNIYEKQKNIYNAEKKRNDNETFFLCQDDLQKDHIENIFQNFFINFFISTNSSHQCRKCEISCFSNNKFHKHLKNCKRNMIMHESIDDISQIIISNVRFSVANVSDDANLRKWHYLMIKTDCETDITSVVIKAAV